MDVLKLDSAIRAVCPIDGVSWSQDGLRIDFQPQATIEQRASAEAIALNWADPPEPDWDGFLDGLDSGVLGAIAQSPMAALITARMSKLSIKPDEWNGASDRLLMAWNASPPFLSAEQRQLLADKATEFHIPLTISQDGLLSASN